MKQVALSIEEMKTLEKLGLDTSDASMYWFVDERRNYSQLMYFFSQCDDIPGDKFTRVPAYTLEDVLEKLYDVIETDNYDYYLDINWHDKSIDYVAYYPKNSISGGDGDILHSETFEYIISLMQAAYNMLLWCIKNDYIKTSKVCGNG